MSDPHQELQALLDEIDDTPAGPGVVALLQRALVLVREVGDHDREFAIRIQLISALNTAGHGDIDTELTCFAWCLAQHDADPRRFPADGFPPLYWYYKWMPPAMSRSPIFPRQHIESVLDDLEERYRRAGFGLGAVYSVRMYVCRNLGDLAEAGRLRTRLLATPRDRFSDCRACDLGGSAEILLESGQEAEGLSQIDELLRSRVRCLGQPNSAMALALLPLLRAGRFDDARTWHHRAYQGSRNKPDELREIAHHITYRVVCDASTGALDLVERHLGWLTHDPLAGDAHLRFLSAAALALDAVAAAGHPDVLVRGSDSPSLIPALGARDGLWPAHELASRAWELADDLSAQFDARNQNRHASHRLAAMRALAGVRYATAT